MNSAIALLVLALFAAVASCYTETEYQTAFTNWMQSNKKVYSTAEFQNRYGAFKGNMDYIKNWNAQNEQTKLGLTVFADMTNEEYKNTYLGTRISKTPGVFSNKAVSNPSSVDWTSQGAVTPIKNQGQCGDCWAFSATGSTEGAQQIATGNLVSLSEQNLMDCSGSYGNNGCNGGLMDYAFKYIIANDGVDTESSYPYQAVQGSCKFQAANVGATITGYTDVTSGSESALQTAIVQQPVSVAIDASHNSFQLYSSGVYYEPACSSTQLDHGVLAVGYGTSGSSDYYIVKNSWGTSWGQAGYIWMSRNRNNNCGIATAASYPTGAGGSNSGSTGKTSHNSSTGKTTHGSSSTGVHGSTGTSQSTYSNGVDQIKQQFGGGRGFKVGAKEQTEKFHF